MTHAQIATGGSNKPTAWYRLGIPAPGVPVGVGTITHLLVVWMMT